MIWQSYRHWRNRIELGKWLEQRIEERNKSVFEAEIIYILNVSIIRASNLLHPDNIENNGSYAMIDCGGKQFKTQTIKN